MDELGTDFDSRVLEWKNDLQKILDQVLNLGILKNFYVDLHKKLPIEDICINMIFYEGVILTR